MSTPEQVVETVQSVEPQVAVASGQRKQKEKQKKPEKKDTASGGSTMGVQAKKSEDFSKWYQQLVQRAELIDYYDVSGCYILRYVVIFYFFFIFANLTTI